MSCPFSVSAGDVGSGYRRKPSRRHIVMSSSAPSLPFEVSPGDAHVDDDVVANHRSISRLYPSTVSSDTPDSPTVFRSSLEKSSGGRTPWVFMWRRVELRRGRSMDSMQSQSWRVRFVIGVVV